MKGRKTVLGIRERKDGLGLIVKGARCVSLEILFIYIHKIEKQYRELNMQLRFHFLY